MNFISKNQVISKFLSDYGALLLLLSIVGTWLTVDFYQEREQIIEESKKLAINKSQLVGSSVGELFLVTDYVLRDIIGRLDIVKDLQLTSKDNERNIRLTAILSEKLETVTGLRDFAVLDRDCRIVATAKSPFIGVNTGQHFCGGVKVNPGQSTHIKYLSAEQSISGRSAVLMSRILGSADGIFLGGVVAVVDLALAQKWIEAIHTEANDVLAIMDADGLLLANKPAQPDAIGKPVPVPMAQFFYSRINDPTSFINNSPYDGRRRITGVSKVERFPFITIVGFDYDRVLKAWRYRMWQFVTGFLLLCIFAVIALRAHHEALCQRERMRKLATTDALTNIANRRHIMDIGNREFTRARRYTHSLSVLMLDIDKFKFINDRWGHPVGDRVIKELANLLTITARDQDVSGRLGGEEFTVILPHTDTSGAKIIAERLRVVVAEAQGVNLDDNTIVRFTASIGIATLNVEDTSFDMLLQRADRALYKAKENGRNRVESDN